MDGHHTNIHHADWQAYPAPDGTGEHTVVGTLQVLSNVHSTQLRNRRDILVYLPPSYATSNRRYPVIYMQDGQNLFDRTTSFVGGEWQVDETMEALSRDGLEAIVVGIHHMGKQRIVEYTPTPFNSRGRGDPYVAFVCDTLKPIIDRDFRTLADPAHTGIFGSSMGGLISLYAFFRRPDVFGLTGAMSPALWIGGGAIYPDVQQAPFVAGKIYLDHGTREGSARRMHTLLREKGYRDERDLLYVVEEGGKHSESAWARRLPDALRFLLRTE